MTTEIKAKYTKLTADDGMTLTDGETYARIVCTTTPDLWSETEPPAEDETTEEGEIDGNG